jgi:hypothetical protein
MIHFDTDNALGLLLGWFQASMRQLWGSQPTRGTGMVMACPLWGTKFVENFGKYCLPSIVSPRNLAALQNRCRIVIFSDARSTPRIMEMLDYLEPHGIEIIFREIPGPIMEKLTKNGKHYWLLGACQNIAVQMCRRWGMALHMLQPDHTYCDGYFENLFRIQGGVDCIAQTSISADLEPAAKDLAKYVNADKELVVPPRDLATIGYKHLHKQMRMYAMNNCSLPDKMPNSHYMFWQARDKLMIYCCHMNPAWLSAELCARVPVPHAAGIVASTLDTRLPFIVTNGSRLYIPGPDDGMVFIELSDDTKPAVPDFVDAMGFAMAAWGQVWFFDDFMPYFEQVCEVPIRRQKKFIEEAEIIRRHAAIIELLKAKKGEAAVLRWQRFSGIQKIADLAAPIFAPPEESAPPESLAETMFPRDQEIRRAAE